MASLGSCSICFGSLAENSPPISRCSPCGHVAHKECLRRWEEQQRRVNSDNSPSVCPNCKQPVDKFETIFVDIVKSNYMIGLEKECEDLQTKLAASTKRHENTKRELAETKKLLGEAETMNQKLVSMDQSVQSIVDNYYMFAKHSGAAVDLTSIVLAAIEEKIGDRLTEKMKQALEEVVCQRWKHIGHGSHTFSKRDEKYLLYLQKKRPGRSLADYRRRLRRKTGTEASTSVISAWFCHRHAWRTSMVKTDPVPLTKFLPRNVEHFQQYGATIQEIDPYRIKFINEKAFKSMELIGCHTGQDPEMGEVPPHLQPKDFKHRYGIIGMCTIQRGMAPLTFEIMDCNVTAEIFMSFVEMLVEKGLLKKGDVLVLDNASWHRNSEADDIEDFLWEAEGLDGKPINVLCVFLPTYLPELNPIELVWNIFVKKKQDQTQEFFARRGKHAMARQAVRCMQQITHEDVEGCFRHCGYLPKLEQEESE